MNWPFGLFRSRAYALGFKTVMRHHKCGTPYGTILFAVMRLDAHNKWPEEVRGSWDALEILTRAKQ